jgi:hypothetical protein
MSREFYFVQNFNSSWIPAHVNENMSFYLNPPNKCKQVLFEICGWWNFNTALKLRFYDLKLRKETVCSRSLAGSSDALTHCTPLPEWPSYASRWFDTGSVRSAGRGRRARRSVGGPYDACYILPASYLASAGTGLQIPKRKWKDTFPTLHPASRSFVLKRTKKSRDIFLFAVKNTSWKDCIRIVHTAVLFQSSVSVCRLTHVNLLSKIHDTGDMFRLPSSHHQAYVNVRTVTDHCVCWKEILIVCCQTLDRKMWLKYWQSSS